jgi:hypothetical protein
LSWGRTNTPEFGHSAIIDNLLFGSTSTLFLPGKHAGGSSGRSVAAVADGLLPSACFIVSTQRTVAVVLEESLGIPEADRG